MSKERSIESGDSNSNQNNVEQQTQQIKAAIETGRCVGSVLGLMASAAVIFGFYEFANNWLPSLNEDDGVYFLGIAGYFVCLNNFDYLLLCLGCG